MTKPLVALLVLGACTPEARYERALKRVDSPGAQLTVTSAAGAPWDGAVGLAAPDDPMTVEHAFLVGSNTKMMTATVVLQLIDEGALALTDPVATWVPSLDPAITVRHVLQHTSGLGDYFEHPTLAADDEARASEVWAPEALVALGREVRDDGPQATGTYANTNFIVAGLVVEALEQRPLDAVFDARLFGPLGMRDSGLLVSGDLTPSHLAMGDGGQHGVLTRYDPSVGWAAGSAYATGADMQRFLGAIMTGELLSDASHEAQHAPIDADLGFEEDGVHTAYGLGVMVVEAQGQTIVGHLGGVDGFTTASFADPDSGAQVVLLSNGTQVDVAGPAVRALTVAASH